jgi:ASC-1-like (ASCH) protein
MQEIGIESAALEEILLGNKTIEGRLGKPKFLKLRVGDELNLREDIWEDNKITESIPNRAIIKITQLLYFETLIEMLESIDITKLIPTLNSPEDALAVYRKFYSEEDEEEYGVIAITFELVG